MEPDQVEAAPEPVESAAPELAVEASEPGNDAAPTMAEVLAEARAELALEESTPAADGDAKASPEQSTPGDSEATPQQAAETVPERKITSQGELDRILTLVQQGREAELDPAARGVLRKLDEQAEARRQKEDGFRKLYLGFEGEKFEDPDAFADKVLADPDIAVFMNDYKRKHPEISLENPNAQPKQPDPQMVRAQVVAEFDDAVTQVAAELTRKAGLDDASFAKLAAESGGKVGELLIRSFDAAVDARIAALTPAIKASEREAAQLEAQAVYANKTIVTPRVIGGVPVNGVKRDPSAPFSFGDAIREAQAELEAAG